MLYYGAVSKKKKQGQKLDSSIYFQYLLLKQAT